MFNDKLAYDRAAWPALTGPVDEADMARCQVIDGLTYWHDGWVSARYYIPHYDEPEGLSESDQAISDRICWAISQLLRRHTDPKFWLELGSDFVVDGFFTVPIFPDGTTLEQVIERIEAEAKDVERQKLDLEMRSRARRKELIRQLLVDSLGKLGIVPTSQLEQVELGLAALGRNLEFSDLAEAEIRSAFDHAIASITGPYKVAYQRRDLICSVFCSQWPAGYLSSFDRLLDVAEAIIFNLGKDPSDEDLRTAALRAIEQVRAEEQHRVQVYKVLGSDASYPIPDIKRQVEQALLDAPVGSSEESLQLIKANLLRPYKDAAAGHSSAMLQASVWMREVFGNRG